MGLYQNNSKFENFTCRMYAYIKINLKKPNLNLKINLFNILKSELKC